MIITEEGLIHSCLGRPASRSVDATYRVQTYDALLWSQFESYTKCRGCGRPLSPVPARRDGSGEGLSSWNTVATLLEDHFMRELATLLKKDSQVV